MVKKSPPKSVTGKGIWIAIVSSFVICNFSFAMTFLQQNVISQRETLEISNPDVSMAFIAFLGISLWMPLFGIACFGLCFLVILLFGNWPHAGSRNFWFVSVALVSLTSFLSFSLASPMNKDAMVAYSSDLLRHLVLFGVVMGIIRLNLYFGRKLAARKLAAERK